MNEHRKFQSPAILTGIRYLSDGGLSLNFKTNELTDEDKIIIGKFHNQFGFILFRANAFKDEDIPKGEANDENKTPSQRLRSVLYVLYEQKYKDKYIDFDTFYRMYFNKIIEQIKDKLE